MVASLSIVNAQVPGFAGLQQIVIENGIIRDIAPQSLPSSKLPLMDVEGDWISLGGVDLQINGALGLAFPDLSDDTIDQLDTIGDFLWHQGIDGFLPTIVTTSVENIQRSLATITKYLASSHRQSSQILGVHLEGPFLNSEKRGAHPAEFLLPLTIENLQRVLGDDAPIVKIMTLAPELDPTGETIAYLKSLGITVSLGHSQATATQAQQAFDRGASMVTHAFNAMPSLHHREPGLLGAAIVNPTVYCGLIADGQHVNPIMVDLLLRSSHYEQGIFLVSDALAPLGLPDGCYPWDSRQIEVKNGTARLSDGTLSGTTLPLLVGVKNLVEWKLCSLEQAISLATLSPRTAIGLPSSYINQPATLLRWHQNEETQSLTWHRLQTEANPLTPYYAPKNYVPDSNSGY